MISKIKPSKKSVSIFNEKLFLSLLFIVVLLPWLRGGEIIWQYLIYVAVIFVMLAISIKHAYYTQHNLYLNQIYRITLLLICWCCYTLFQTIDLPIWIVDFISPNLLSIKQELSTSNNPTNKTSISISQYATLIETLKYGSYVGVFLITYLIINTQKKLTLLIETIFFSSALITLYALINFFTDGSINITKPLPPWDFYTNEIIYGTFSYKNHFASFLILTLPLGIGLFFHKKNTIKITKLEILNFISSKRFFILSCVLMMLIALILNSSRAGNASFILSILITCLILFVIYRERINYTKIKIIVCTAIIFIILIISTGISDTLISRVQNTGENGREHLRTTAISIIEDYTITGTGAGTFPDIHHKYKSEQLTGSIMWQRVHNDYLEMLATSGLIGFSLLGIAILTAMLQLLIKLNKTPTKLYSIQVSCFCSLLCILIHSMADFNFQLPVNAVYFYIILAIGLKAGNMNKFKSNITRD